MGLCIKICTISPWAHTNSCTFYQNLAHIVFPIHTTSLHVGSTDNYDNIYYMGSITSRAETPNEEFDVEISRAVLKRIWCRLIPHLSISRVLLLISAMGRPPYGARENSLITPCPSRYGGKLRRRYPSQPGLKDTR